MWSWLGTNCSICSMQYAPLYFRHIHGRTTFLFERYSLLLCIGIVWAFAAILTAAGAYNHVSLKTQQHCRTDKSFLISSAPWYSSWRYFLWTNFTNHKCLEQPFLIHSLHACTFRIKISYPFHWGPPIFTAGHSFGMMGAVLVSSFEVKTNWISLCSIFFRAFFLLEPNCAILCSQPVHTLQLHV